MESLLKRCEVRARGLAYALAGNPEEAKELVQEASFRAFKNRERHDPLKGFERWYLTILKNAFLDCRKRHEFRFGIPLLAPVDCDEDDCALIDRIADSGPGVEDEAERDEAVSAVRKAIQSMRPNHREVVNLCDIEGKDYEEAASELGVPLGTVRSRLSRAREALRKKLSQEWAETKEIEGVRKS